MWNKISNWFFFVYLVTKRYCLPLLTDLYAGIRTKIFEIVVKRSVRSPIRSVYLKIRKQIAVLRRITQTLCNWKGLFFIVIMKWEEIIKDGKYKTFVFHIYHPIDYKLFSIFCFTSNNRFNNCYCSNVNNVTNRTLAICKVDRFVQSHLNWAD